jgi:hypothetical protein
MSNSNKFSGSVVASEAMFKTLAKTHIKESWGHTFVKEIWQNTVDLDSVSKLEIEVSEVFVASTLYDWFEHTPQYYKVSFRDDGPGMSLDILKNVYLYYGETTKAHNQDSIGGYGLGRVVCTFGAVSYRLRSQDWECTGVGGQYSVETGLSWIDGFIIEAVIPSVDRSGYAADVYDSIEEYINECSSNRITVSLNGRTLSFKQPSPESIVPLRLDNDPSSWATVQYVNNKSTSLKVCAINSHQDVLFLYSEYLYSSQYAVNINVYAGLTKVSMDLSRTSFSGVYGIQVDEIKNKLSKDIKMKTQTKTFIEGSFEEAKVITTSCTAQTSTIKGKDVTFDLADLLQIISTLKNMDVQDDSVPVINAGLGLPYIISCCEVEKAEMDELKTPLLEEFYLIWDKLIDLILFNVLSTIIPIKGKAVNTGILLSKDSLGMCSTSGSLSTIVANPYLISSFGMLVSTAMHESCHVGFHSHNEDFSCALSNLNGAMYGITFKDLEARFYAWQDSMGLCKQHSSVVEPTVVKPILKAKPTVVKPILKAKPAILKPILKAKVEVDLHLDVVDFLTDEEYFDLYFILDESVYLTDKEYFERYFILDHDDYLSDQEYFEKYFVMDHDDYLSDQEYFEKYFAEDFQSFIGSCSSVSVELSSYSNMEDIYYCDLEDYQ